MAAKAHLRGQLHFAPRERELAEQLHHRVQGPPVLLQRTRQLCHPVRAVVESGLMVMVLPVSTYSVRCVKQRVKLKARIRVIFCIYTRWYYNTL